MWTVLHVFTIFTFSFSLHVQEKKSLICINRNKKFQVNTNTAAYSAKSFDINRTYSQPWLVGWIVIYLYISIYITKHISQIFMIFFPKEIYRKGGRKFGFLNLGDLGCFPGLRILDTKSEGGCLEDASSLATLHNSVLAKTLSEIEMKLHGFKHFLYDFNRDLA